jgi:hypothetical protein
MDVDRLSLPLQPRRRVRILKSETASGESSTASARSCQSIRPRNAFPTEPRKKSYN